MYLNRVELIGFLGSDAETKTTTNGKTVTTLSLATKTTYKKDGERQERTELHRSQCWGRLGEYAAAFLMRNSIGFEVDEHYFEAAHKRIAYETSSLFSRTAIKVRKANNAE